MNHYYYPGSMDKEEVRGNVKVLPRRQQERCKHELRGRRVQDITFGWGLVCRKCGAKVRGYGIGGIPVTMTSLMRTI